LAPSRVPRFRPPVGCFPQSVGRFAIIASNGGAPRNPDWCYNLSPNPPIGLG
jgi:hypothetical protein